MSIIKAEHDQTLESIYPPKSWTVYDLSHPKGYRTFYNEEAARAHSREIANQSKGEKI